MKAEQIKRLDAKLRLVYPYVDTTPNGEYTLYQSLDYGLIMSKTGKIIYESKDIMLEGIMGVEYHQLIYIVDVLRSNIIAILDTCTHKLIHLSFKAYELTDGAYMAYTGMYCNPTKAKAVKISEDKTLNMQYCSVETTSGKILIKDATMVRLVDSDYIRYTMGANVLRLNIETGISERIGSIGSKISMGGELGEYTIDAADLRVWSIT